MPRRDTVAINTAIVANWYARVGEEMLREGAGEFPGKLMVALTGPHFDTPEFKSKVVSKIRASYTPAEVKVVALFLRLNASSRARAFALVEMIQRKQLPDLQRLSEGDRQLLKDAFDLSKEDASLKFGQNHLRTAKALKKRNRRTYGRVEDDALTQRLKRVHGRVISRIPKRSGTQVAPS
jgi:hypothetical protein